MSTAIEGETYEGPASKFDDSRFINASTLAGLGELTLTIDDVVSLKAGFKFQNGRSLDSDTLCLRFTNSPKVLKLNKTNLRVCMKILGNDCSEWVGRKVKAFTDPTVKFGGREVGGVVIKEEVLAA